MINNEALNQNIIPIWQPQGFSTHIIASKVAEKLGTKTSHTGTLDPMAEGVIIVLADENRNKKYELAEWLKEYEFEITLGVQTDTGDALGLIKKTDFSTKEVTEPQVAHILRKFVGEYEQQVPVYSAIKVEGKPLHWYARNDKLDEIEIPRRYGEIHELEFEGSTHSYIEDMIDDFESRILRVSGDLRQGEIIQCWNELKMDHSQIERKIHSFKLRVVMTKGLYVRQLAQDILNKMQQIGFVSELIRTANGEYTKENSYTLEEFFGENFKNIYNFDSDPDY